MIALKIKLTHQDLADLIASTKESVTATISTLKKQEIVDYEGERPAIKSLEPLRAVAEDGSPG